MLYRLSDRLYGLVLKKTFVHLAGGVSVRSLHAILIHPLNLRKPAENKTKQKNQNKKHNRFTLLQKIFNRVHFFILDESIK